MFTKEKIALFIAIAALATYFASAGTDPFEKAIDKAKIEQLTEVDQAKGSVPFYRVNTLDPTWEESSIVQLSKLDLVDQNNNRQSEKLFDNKITFVAFFFASCAGFCPTLLRSLQDVEVKVRAHHEDVQFVAITVDPLRDSPRELKKYFEKMKMSKSWKLLTGDKNSIYSLAHDIFAAEVFQLPKSRGQISHSEHFFVLDEKRRLRGVLKGTRLDVGEKAETLLSQL